MTYLTDAQINEMAQEASTNYEFSCEWNKAAQAANEYAIEEFGVKPNKSAVLLAVKLAKTQWMGYSMKVGEA